MKKLMVCFAGLLATLSAPATPAIAESESDVIRNPQWVGIKSEGVLFHVNKAGLNIGTYILNMGLQPAVEADIINPDSGYTRVQIVCHVTDPRFKAMIGSYRPIRAGDFGAARRNGDLPVSFARVPGLMRRPSNSLEKAIARNVCVLWGRKLKSER
jgi:hypothetical protein